MVKCVIVRHKNVLHVAKVKDFFKPLFISLVTRLKGPVGKKKYELFIVSVSLFAGS